MRVTLLAQFFPPETFAGANRIAAMARALADRADVVVVTLRPSYPDPGLYDQAQARDSVAPNLRVERTTHFVPHRRSWLSRALGEQRMALRLLVAGLRHRSDVVVASSPSMFLGPAALVLARMRRARFVWDLRDITWQYAEEARIARGALAVGLGLASRLMWSVAARADLLVAATPGIAAVLAERYPDRRVRLVPNTVAADWLARLDPSPPPGKARPIVAYAGLVGHAQDLGVLCDVAADLPQVDFVVAGDGPDRPRLAEATRARGLENLRFAGYLPPEELAELYRESDILFGQLRETALHTTTALPSKLFEYMATARPIVYGGSGLAADTVREAGCGLAVRPADRGAIRAAVTQLLADPEGARAMGRSGRAFAEGRRSREDEMTALATDVARFFS